MFVSASSTLRPFAQLYKKPDAKANNTMLRFFNLCNTLPLRPLAAQPITDKKKQGFNFGPYTQEKVCP